MKHIIEYPILLCIMNIYNSHVTLMTIEIVDFPIKNGDFIYHIMYPHPVILPALRSQETESSWFLGSNFKVGALFRR